MPPIHAKCSNLQPACGTVTIPRCGDEHARIPQADIPFQHAI